MNEQQIDQLRAVADHAEQVNSAVYLAPRSLRSLLDQLDQAEAELDSWMTRAYEAEGKLWKAEARIRHLEDTAQVLVKEVLDAENARDESRRGKVEAEARIKAVENLHVYENRPVEKWARGHRFTGEHCAHDGQQWPCRTIRALDGT